jgi:hypothetical protein
MAWRPYQDIVSMWIARSLSATRSSGTFAACLMSPFHSLSSSGGGGISIQGTCSASIQCAHGSLVDNNPGYLVYMRGDSRCFIGFLREEHLFPQQKAIGRGLFFEHQPDLLVRLTTWGLLYECVCAMPSFFLPLRLRLTSRRSVFRPSLKLCWLHLIPVGQGLVRQSRCLVFTTSPWTYSPET